jgi:hypothetical protein
VYVQLLLKRSVYENYSLTSEYYITKKHSFYMKKYSLIALGAMLTSASLWANPVSVQQAQQVARNFVAEKGGKNSAQLALAQTVQANSNTNLNTYYVFDVNYSNNSEKGFVIVAADDVVKPILAYSFANAYESNTQLASPETKYWTNLYNLQIEHAVNNNFVATADVVSDWDYWTSTVISENANKPTAIIVAPLLTTTWNQGTHYDIYTPGTGSGKTPVGCVATAMAQIMKYWNAPTTGTGSYSYTQSPYGTLSADFGAATYAWGLMPNALTNSSSQAAKEAVSLLGYHCAIAVKMNFSPGGSGSQVLAWNANARSAENAFKNHFGYKTTIQGRERDDYSMSTWLGLLKTELDNARPILYAGFGTNGGHAFVFDGYDDQDLFHVNWGWGGMSDGYFTVSNLSPSALGTGGGAGGFNSGQQALFNIEPSIPGDTLNMVMNSGITMSADTIYKGQAFSATYSLWNKGTYDFGGILGAALYKVEDSAFVGYVRYLSAQSLLGGAQNTFLLENAGSANIPGGQYFAKAIYRPEGTSAWLAIPTDAGFTNKAFFTILDTITPPAPNAIEDITLNQQFQLYPNPATQFLTLEYSSFVGTVNAINIVNIQGQKVNAIAVPQQNKSTTVNISTLASGIYYINLITDKGVINKKFVVKH